MKSTLIFGAFLTAITSGSFAQGAVLRGTMTVQNPVAIVATVPTAASYDVHIVSSQFTVAPGQYNLLLDNSKAGVLGLTVVDEVGNYRKISIVVPRSNSNNVNNSAVRLTSSEISQNFDVTFSTRQISVNEPAQVRGVVCDKHAKRGYRYWKTQTVARVGTETDLQIRLVRPGTNEVLAVINQPNQDGVRDQVLSETKCVEYDGRTDDQTTPKSFDLMGLLMKTQSR